MWRGKDLIKVKDDIEFTNISKIFVQGLNISVNDFQGDEFIVFVVNANHKVKAGVSEEQERLKIKIKIKNWRRRIEK